ncbi:MAG TPA: methionine--tRNA ligase [Candidatus Binatia bacterium]|nr:methionine--tRNA ligase [Candidatus Binatia bacterium]
MSGPFYLTTPIYYINAPPHLGSACTTIMADAMCRYRRLAGDRVWLLTGTDEHGERIAQVAAEAGLSPQALADRNSALFREEWQRLAIANDDFIRTTEPRHQAVVQRILQDLWDRGEIYFGEYGGHYCYGCERFYTEKEIVDGKCPDHQAPLTYIKEKNYFFRMSKYQGRLINHVERHPDFIQPERYRNEVLGFLREPLQDLSISRPTSRLTWGIPLPFDEHYVTYVWFDALLNYVSALGYPDDERFATFWPEAIHLIGKDILKPHGVYWPAMLWAAGLPLYRGLRVHGYWSVEGRKMSKSLGNVVGAYTLADKYGREALRYFVLREMPFGLDADFSEEAFVGRLNADLANDLGNLVSRATTVIASFGGGALPVPGPDGPDEAGLRAALERTRAEVAAAMDEFAFQRALAAIWEFIGGVNRYVDAAQPWSLARRPDQAERLRTVLYALGESLRCLGILLDAFLPEAAARIRAGVGAGAPRLADLRWGGAAAGTAVQKVTGLFPRVDTKAGATGPAHGGLSAKAPGPARIGIDDFRKIELRVAEVVSAERVPKSKKLLKLGIAVGPERRTLVAGIAEHYEPAALIGRKVVVVANLEPATLMGIESNGMVLAGSDGGTLALLTLDRDLPPGARVT